MFFQSKGVGNYRILLNSNPHFFGESGKALKREIRRSSVGVF